MTTTQNTRRRPGFGDLMRREWYMTRLDWGLRNLPSKQNRQIQRDLRRDVTATAADTGMRRALADLGSPRLLAEQYTETIGAEGPRPGSGAIGAGVTFAFLVFLGVAYAIGTLQTLLFMGGGTRTVNLWGTAASFTATSGETSIQLSNVLPMIGVAIAISAIAFLVFARMWRLVGVRR